MTAPAARYTPSKPGDSAVLDTYAREMHAAGMPMDRAREVALRLYIAGFSAGVGEYVAEPKAATDEIWMTTTRIGDAS